jgi:hypothetical protein
MKRRIVVTDGEILERVCPHCGVDPEGVKP